MTSNADESTRVYALLLTDVVDSTQLSERMGAAATALLWSAHDRCARDLLPQWHGREIDKTDGMLLLFDGAADAANYALAYHRALASLDPPLSARVGLHVGPIVLRENSAVDIARGAKPLEVDGAAKALTARVMAIAAGGQTLLSADARNAAGDIGRRIESHGHWRLKGIAEPIELFEIGETEAAFVPPPDAAKAYRVVWKDDTWLPVRDIRTTLPAERDSFIGRRDTLDDLAQRFDAGFRLVSVLGIGGTGKTRLAMRFGWTWLGDYPGGVWFCDLSQARSLDGIAFAVAQGLDVPLGKGDPVAQLGHAIAGRGQCLLILDNFEQVARHADDTLGQWLNRAPDARFLVTTREMLGLKGEQVMAVAPLKMADAVTLFLRRAESAKPGFQLQPGDSGLVTTLVKLLDCLPLAIELAAARVRVMAPRMLLARMSERFKLLSSVGGRQDRQSTLRAVLDWSWDLLASPERAALAQLSVFEGGFTLESTEAVLDLSAYDDAPFAMDALQSLVQKSFVRQVSDVRFDLLVSVKEYAADHLRSEGRYPGSGPAAQHAAEVRHGEYFAAADRKIATLDKGIELDNFIVATRRAAVRGDAVVAADALERAWAGLRFCGPYRVGAELATLARSTAGLTDEGIAVTEWVAGSALSASGKDDDALAHLELSLAAARRAGDQSRECRALVELAFTNILAGRTEAARQHAAPALDIARQIGDRHLVARAENTMGHLCEIQGQLQGAAARYESALSLARATDDSDLEGSVLSNLANVLSSQGKLADAQTQMEAAIAVAQRMGNKRLEGNAQCNLGVLYQVQGRFAMAEETGLASLAIARDLGNIWLESLALCNVGMACEAAGRYDDARRHYEGAVDIARRLGHRRHEGQFLGYLGRSHARQARIDDARECLSKGEEYLRAASDPISLAILLTARAETECLAGEPDAAKTALAEAEGIAGETESGAGSELGLAIAQARTLLEGTATG